jgi:fructose/tagatose bisphosphate aldolase
MKTLNRLRVFAEKRACTLLGVGPMSKNTVDAALEIAAEYAVPLMLIASRRQIECAEMGGGYVNNWSTEAFAAYVKAHDTTGEVILARDHGGPWQNPIEVKKNMTREEAMASAKRSFEVDIRSGFEIIHIDPSVSDASRTSIDEVLSMVFELYRFCHEVAAKISAETGNAPELIIEIGTDEQAQAFQDLEKFEYVLERVSEFCEQYGFPKPTFVVAQTGTKVIETQNVGELPRVLAMPGASVPATLVEVTRLCQHHGIWLKAHNADYLSDEVLRWHPKLGIHAANVAPEFAITETRAFLKLLRENELHALAEEFIELADASKKWEKWLSVASTATKEERAVIAGHYVYATPQFAKIKSQAQAKLKKKSIVIDDILRHAVKASIMRYLYAFNMLEKQKQKRAA